MTGALAEFKEHFCCSCVGLMRRLITTMERELCFKEVKLLKVRVSSIIFAVWNQIKVLARLVVPDFQTEFNYVLWLQTKKSAFWVPGKTCNYLVVRFNLCSIFQP